MPRGEPAVISCTDPAAAWAAALDVIGVPQARRFSETFAPDPSFAVLASSEPALIVAE